MKRKRFSRLHICFGNPAEELVRPLANAFNADWFLGHPPETVQIKRMDSYRDGCQWITNIWFEINPDGPHGKLVLMNQNDNSGEWQEVHFGIVPNANGPVADFSTLLKGLTGFDCPPTY